MLKGGIPIVFFVFQNASLDWISIWIISKIQRDGNVLGRGNERRTKICDDLPWSYKGKTFRKHRCLITHVIVHFYCNLNGQFKHYFWKWLENFFFQVHLNMSLYMILQTVRKPPSESSSLASGKSGSSSSSSKSGGSKSSESHAEKGGEPTSPFPSNTISGARSASTATGPRGTSRNGHYPKNIHSSQSSVENHYPKSNGSNPYG